jgi:hypothetical protein
MRENQIAICYIQAKLCRLLNIAGQRNESKMFNYRTREGKVCTSEYITEEPDAVILHVRICVGSAQ